MSDVEFLDDFLDNYFLMHEVDGVGQILDAIFNSISEGVYLRDPQGHLTYVNQRMAEMLGYSHTKELLGKKINHFFLLPGQRDEVLSNQTQHNDKFEVLLRKGNNESGMFNVKVTRLIQGGQLYAVLGVIQSMEHYNARATQLLSLEALTPRFTAMTENTRTSKIALMHIQLQHAELINNGETIPIDNYIYPPSLARITTHIKPTDLLIHLENNDLLLLLSEHDIENVVRMIGERLVHAFEDVIHTKINGEFENIKVKICIGASWCKKDSGRLKHLLQDAADALSKAGHIGYGQLVTKKLGIPSYT